MYYGEIDETLRAELAQWSAHSWNRVDTGATAKVGEFAFSNAALNNPLFNPLRGVRPTLEQVKVINAADCDGLAALQPGWGDTTIAAAFRDAMKDWKISTDTTTNATGTAVHLALIAAAPAGAGTTWTTVGNLVVSEKLPLAGVTGANAEPTMATTVSFETQEAINKLIVVGPIIAAASAGTTEAQALITGEESHATKFERGVQTLLADGGWEGTTWRVDAAFGVFGSLPLVGVTFGDAFVLVDSVNGNLDGPFALSSLLDVSTLLVSHTPYTSLTSTSLIDRNGCVVVAAPRWRSYPPPNWCTPVPPAGCWTPFPPNPPGYPPPPAPTWMCRSTGPGTTGCTCIFYDIGRDTDGRVVPVRMVCDCTACGVFGFPTGPSYGPSPVTPWPPPAVPGPPGAGCTCRTEWKH